MKQAKLSTSPFQESMKETSQILLLIGTTVIFFTTVSIIVFESVKRNSSFHFSFIASFYCFLF